MAEALALRRPLALVPRDRPLRRARALRARAALKLPGQRESCSELPIDSRPGNSGGSGQVMKAVGKPDIKIDGHAPAGHRADGAFTDRQRMSDKRLIKYFVKHDGSLAKKRVGCSCLGSAGLLRGRSCRS